MFYVYTPYVTPSGKRLSHNKIIIYEAVRDSQSKYPRFNNVRKFELMKKGWKITKTAGRVYLSVNQTTTSLEYVVTVPLANYQLLLFDSFDNAYAAKCILINRIPEVYLNMISVLTTKMNSLKSVTPDLRHMSDSVPELFI